jgi:hypothetical protein
MSLVTGTPEGNVISQNEVYIEGAPWIYYQDNTANPLNNPDGDGYYWGMSGTSSQPAYELACYEDVALSEDLTINNIRCDKRNYLELSITLSTMFPLTTTAPIFKSGSTVLSSAPFEKMGIGVIDNLTYYRIWLPKVYDEDSADYVSITLHRAQFVDAFNISMASGDAWKIGGISIRAFADDNLPTAQQFATVVRYDPSLIT